MVEVFTIGGGEYIVNVFNAVAAWTGGGGYRALLRVVMVLGFIYALMAVAFTMNVRAWLNWFLGSALIYSCLMVSTVTVKVTDRINPSLAPAVVANVPLGLGVMASFTSQVGDWLTRTAETVFVMPNELNYSTNGMIYGSRLFDMTRNFQIRDAEFSTNLQMHFKNCVFGDILLHRKSLTVLSQAKDLWAELGPGSPARGQPWIARDGSGMSSQIVTCEKAYSMLSGQWKSMIDAATDLWGKEAYTRMSTTQAAAKLRQDVPVIAQAFTGSSGDYTSTMRQMTAINAFMQARDGMAGGPGSASIDTFATTRADIQARNTYNSISQQAMTWVPILNIVLTVVFYAMFPVIFPLFLMPQTGVQALKGYLTGFFYLASWGPLYVILHMICMSRGMSAANGVAEGGVSLGSFAGIGAVNAETATIAGFMLMSVPFMAAALSRGAMSISGQSMSMLNPAQNAAEAAAVEQTTGNYSYGNVSFANSSSNMHQGNQWSDAPTYTTGAAGFTERANNGATRSAYGNGESVYNVSGAMSQLGTGFTENRGIAADLRQTASEMRRQARSEEEAAARILTSTNTDRASQGTSTTIGSGFETSSSNTDSSGVENFYGNSGSTFNGIEDRSSVGNGTKVSGSHRRSSDDIDATKGGYSVSLGGGGSGSGAQGGSGGAGRASGTGASSPRPKAGVEGGRTMSAQQTDNLAHSTERTQSNDDTNTASGGVRNEKSGGERFTDGSGHQERTALTSRNERSSTASRSREQALSEAATHELRARKLNERADQLSNEASYMESHNFQVSQNLSQDFSQWYERRIAGRQGLDAPSPLAVVMTPQQRQVRDQLMSEYLASSKQEIMDSVAPRLHEPDLVDVPASPITSEADVRGHHRPGGLLPVNIPGSLPDTTGAAGRIAAGQAGIADEGRVASVMRQGHLDAGSGVRNEVDKDMNRQFFTDPKAREMPELFPGSRYLKEKIFGPSEPTDKK
jgi:conjugal transfer mating pair stabilization protein TraG